MSPAINSFPVPIDPCRFVVLTHDHPFLHWDLMLEQAGVLRTWRLHSEPDATTSIAAEKLPDHRLAYLDYEGPLSNNRGQVTRWDGGVFTQTEDSCEQIVCRVSGDRLAGVIRLTWDDVSATWEFQYQAAETT